MTLQFVIPQEQIFDFCQRWNITRMEVFGSAIRDDFSPGSDIDLLVEYKPDFHRTVMDMECMQREIETLFQRPVDLITKSTIERSPNPYKRQNMLLNTQVIYG